MLGYFIFTFWCSISFLFCFFDSIPSSKACGPFKSFNTSWEVVPDTILGFPVGLQQVLHGIASEAFAVPFFVVIWWVLWRLDSVMQLYGSLPALLSWYQTIMDQIFRLHSKASKPTWILSSAHVLMLISFILFPLACPISHTCLSQKC